MNYLSCIRVSNDQLMKETIMIWRCIDQWLHKRLLHSKISWLPKTIATLYCEGKETYRLQPKDKTKWDIGREVLRGTIWEKEKWKTS